MQNAKQATPPDDIPVLQVFHTLYVQWSGVHAKFPKAKRYSLGTKCDEMLIGILTAVCQAAHHEPSRKLPFINEASSRLDVAKVLFRVAKDVRCVTNDDYVSMQSKLNEIGRMIGGWMKSYKERA